MESISIFHHSCPHPSFIGRTLKLSDMPMCSLRRQSWGLDPKPMCLNPVLFPLLCTSDLSLKVSLRKDDVPLCLDAVVPPICKALCTFLNLSHKLSHWLPSSSVK